MPRSTTDLVFDPRVVRALVAADPFLAYTQARRPAEPEEQWLQRLFESGVLSDPSLRYQYRTLAARLPSAAENPEPTATPAEPETKQERGAAERT